MVLSQMAVVEVVSEELSVEQQRDIIEMYQYVTGQRSQIPTALAELDEKEIELTELQINYDGLMAGHGYIIKDPTYGEMIRFLEDDDTDEGDDGSRLRGLRGVLRLPISSFSLVAITLAVIVVMVGRWARVPLTSHSCRPQAPGDHPTGED